MRATFALLTNRAIENRINRLAWDIHRRWRIGIGVRRLPPHISLKQPFPIGDDLAVLEQYFADFTSRLAPFSITVGRFHLWGTTLTLSIAETPELRELHNRLNRELLQYFGNVAADYDGEDYQFHLTVSQGGATPHTYQEILGSLASQPLTESFQATEIALFVYDELEPGSWEYMTHTVLPLSGSTTF